MNSSLTEYSDEVWISSEDLDVVPDPGESHHLVQLPHVARDLLLPQGEVAQGPQPVVDGHHDDVVGHPVLRPEAVRSAVPGDEPSAMDPDHDREEVLRLGPRDVEEEVESVLALEF